MPDFTFKLVPKPVTERRPNGAVPEPKVLNRYLCNGLPNFQASHVVTPRGRLEDDALVIDSVDRIQLLGSMTLNIGQWLISRRTGDSSRILSIRGQKLAFHPGSARLMMVSSSFMDKI